MLLKEQPPIPLCLRLGSCNRISNTKTTSDLGSLGFFVSLDVFLNKGTRIRPHNLMEASQYNLLVTTTNTIQTLLGFTIATYPADFMTSVVFYDFFSWIGYFHYYSYLWGIAFCNQKNIIKMAKSTKRILEPQSYTSHGRWS